MAAYRKISFVQAISPIQTKHTTTIHQLQNTSMTRLSVSIASCTCTFMIQTSMLPFIIFKPAAHDVRIPRVISPRIYSCFCAGLKFSSFSACFRASLNSQVSVRVSVPVQILKLKFCWSVLSLLYDYVYNKL